ncbi:MAG TPA: hypothetical protein VFC48_06885 [Cellulomonas sp.]|nr:hypothetical protein [Cellulomonas sp.]
MKAANSSSRDAREAGEDTTSATSSGGKQMAGESGARGASGMFVTP